MRALYRSLLGQLSGILFITALGVGAATSAALVMSFLRLSDFIEQLTHSAVAASLAHDMEPACRPGMHIARALDQLRRITEANPNYDVYVLDHDGNVEAHSPARLAPIRTQVDLQPVLRRIASYGETQELIRGTDPMAKKDTSVFSAAPMSFHGEPGFLYVILRGTRFRYAGSIFGETQIYWSLALYLAAALIVIVLAGVALVVLVLRRLRGMTGILLAYSEGNYAQRIPDIGEDELGVHARAFNTMADRIERAVGDLQRSETTRRELVANVSHDLRTPVAAAQGLIESVLGNRDSLREEQKEDLLLSARKSLAHLARLIADLFELSKLEAPVATATAEPFSATELAQDVVGKLTALASAKAIGLAAKIPHEAAIVSGDIGLIERVLTNLVANAIEHTPAGGQVAVEVVHTGQYYRFAVSDTGCGIPAADLPHIFNRFYRVKGRTSSGAGLGLAIARRIIELHNGSLVVESTEGSGSTFSFSLSGVPE